jgi:hypothetical protein
MKYWIMRIPEPIPLGLTFLLAIARAIVRASLVNRPSAGKVDSVLTFRTHLFPLLRARVRVCLRVTGPDLSAHRCRTIAPPVNRKRASEDGALRFENEGDTEGVIQSA